MNQQSSPPPLPSLVNIPIPLPKLSASFPTAPDKSFPILSFSISCLSSSLSTPAKATPSSSPTSSSGTFANYYTNNYNDQRYWMVLMDTHTPPLELTIKPQIIDYYVKTLERVFGSEKEAQMCIYDASCDTHFCFCCDIDEVKANELAEASSNRSHHEGDEATGG